MKLNKNLLLGIITVILIFTYILSFNSHFTKIDSTEKITTELVNEKNKNLITEFHFFQGNKSLFLIKQDDFWIIKSDLYSTTAIPADSTKIEAFISDLIKLRQIRKISEKSSSLENYGLEDADTIYFRYYLENGNCSELIFGGQDFALSSRYLMVSQTAKLFEIDNSFDKYLSLSVQQWSDPNIISKQVLGPVEETDIQSINIIDEIKTSLNFNSNSLEDFYSKCYNLLELRHGGIAEEISDDDPIYIMKIEFGNKEWCTLSIYAPLYEDGDYIVVSKYFIETINKSYTYTSKISLWTYNSIKEITL